MKKYGIKYRKFVKKSKININDLGYLIGPILNAGGRLGKSSYATELLSSNNSTFINKKLNELIVLNNKRREIESIILNDIDFDEIEKNNKSVIIYYNPNINEGLIGIIAARLKDYFNKPSIVITNSNNLLKGSARSIFNFNIGRVMKNLLNENIIISGGGHNMAAGFTIKKENIKLLDNFVQNNYEKNNKKLEVPFKYDFEISTKAINQSLYNSINKLAPFGSGNSSPTFLIKNVKIIKFNKITKNHLSLIIKPSAGPSLNAICFNYRNTEVGNYLLSYKKQINIIAMIRNNSWNNKNFIQLDIKDLFLPTNTS